MKKLLLSIASLFVIGFVSAQNLLSKTENAQLTKIYKALKKSHFDFNAIVNNPTGVLHLQYDTTKKAYDTISRDIYKDYNQVMPTLTTNQTYTNNVFTNNGQSRLYANIDTAAQIFDMDSMQIFDWDSTSNWALYMRIVETYKSQGKPITMTIYANMPNFGWITFYRTNYYYNSNNFVEAMSNYQTSISGGKAILIVSDSSLYTNDANGNHLTEINWKYNDSVYVNNEKYTREFDANNNNTVETTQKWDTVGVDAWKNNTLDSMMYDTKKQETVDVRYTWVGSAWTLPTKYTTAYNSNRQKTLEMTYVPNGNTWRATYRKTYNFTQSGDHDFDLVERSMDGTTWIVENKDTKDIYLYDNTLDVNTLVNTDAISVFPNPSEGNVVLSLGNKISGSSVLVTVYDISGQPVYNNCVSVADKTANLNLSNLQAGMYLLKVTAANTTSVKSIVITQ